MIWSLSGVLRVCEDGNGATSWSSGAASMKGWWDRVDGDGREVQVDPRVVFAVHSVDQYELDLP